MASMPTGMLLDVGRQRGVKGSLHVGLLSVHLTLKSAESLVQNDSFRIQFVSMLLFKSLRACCIFITPNGLKLTQMAHNMLASPPCM